MDSNKQTFSKAERLCSTKIISEIFENGNSFYTAFFKVLWIVSPVILPSPAQVAFTVPKKVFRHAVTRNLIKRRFREAYRRNKFRFYDHLRSCEIQLAFIIVFRQNIIPEYDDMERSVVESLEILIRNILRQPGKC